MGGASALLALLCLWQAAGVRSRAAVYVDPCSAAAADAGNDGTDPQRPFRSIQHAVAVVAGREAGFRCHGGVTVYLSRGCTHPVAGAAPSPPYANLSQGEYNVPQGLVLQQGLGCTDAGNPLWFSAWDAGHGAAGATISGGAAVDLSRDAGPTYSGVVASPADIWDLWLGDTDARIPLASSPPLRYTALVPSPAPNGTCFIDPALSALGVSAEALAHAFVRVAQTWTSAHHRVHSFDAATGRLCLAGVFNAKFMGGSGNRYVVLNAQYGAWLSPQSFVFAPADEGGPPGLAATPMPRREYRLTVAAPPGAASAVLRVVVPQAATVVGLVGAADVHFGPGLVVAHSLSLLSEACLTDCQQSASLLPAAAVEVAYSSDVSFTGVDVAHTGSYGVWVRHGSHNISLSRARLFDLGAGGVRVGEPNGGRNPDIDCVASDVAVLDTTVWGGGATVESGTGVLVQQARRVRILHNTIHDLSYHAVSLGWTWGYVPTSNEQVEVAYNLMYNIGRGRLSDLACVYTLGASPATAVHHNLCHDVYAYGYGGWGFYADQATAHVVFEKNVAYRTKGAGFHFHWGIDVAVRNNVFARPYAYNASSRGADSCGLLAGHETGEAASFAAVANIVLLDDSTSTPLKDAFPNAFANATLDRNVYWSSALQTPPSQLPFPPVAHPSNFTTWAARTGQDARSIVADPRFCADPQNYTCLLPDSPALLRGFVPFNLSGVGARR
eukprot:TRINITY_DN4497_c0_g1_i1.p1 TRINITY_DN4497_c0_g1~~TRINITY_DN4497_c0_g1_i1.p1  ORF type:complete len:725 (+),score=168.69 TRINITY_DN4497_c0_g1_i1:59-2233(+)